MAFSDYQADYLDNADWAETNSVSKAKACQTALKRMLAYAAMSAKGESSFRAPIEAWQKELESIAAFLSTADTTTGSGSPVAFSFEESR